MALCKAVLRYEDTHGHVRYWQLGKKVIFDKFPFKRATSQFAHLEKFSLNVKFVVGNLRQSSPSLTILVPLCFIIRSLVFFCRSKLLFSGFLQFKGNYVPGQNNSK